MNEFEKKLIDFKAIVTSLKEILKQENEALEIFDINKATSLFEAKNKAVEIYRDFTSYFIKNHSSLEALNKEDKDVVKVMIAELNEGLLRNETLLKTRIDVSKNVMNSIISVAKTSNKANSTSYGNMGQYAKTQKHLNSIAINQTL